MRNPKQRHVGHKWQRRVDYCLSYCEDKGIDPRCFFPTKATWDARLGRIGAHVATILAGEATINKEEAAIIASTFPHWLLKGQEQRLHVWSVYVEVARGLCEERGIPLHQYLPPAYAQDTMERRMGNAVRQHLSNITAFGHRDDAVDLLILRSGFVRWLGSARIGELCGMPKEEPLVKEPDTPMTATTPSSVDIVDTEEWEVESDFSECEEFAQETWTLELKEEMLPMIKPEDTDDAASFFR